MTFEELRIRLVVRLRDKIRNGEWTERRLARQCGVSQPHLHNGLKGRRIFSVEIADRLMETAQITVFDLFDLADRQELKRRFAFVDAASQPHDTNPSIVPPYGPS